MLDVGAPRDVRPALQPHPGRLDRLPHVHIRVPQDQHVLPTGHLGHPLGDPRLLGTGHQVIHEHTGPPLGGWAEVGHDLLEVVDAVEHEDDDALVAQVVTPDLLHQLGVVLALHPDPRGARHLGPLTLDRVGARGRQPSAGGAHRSGGLACARHGRVQDHRAALDPETRPQSEAAAHTVAVLQDHDVLAARLLHRHRGPDEAGLAVLDHQSRCHRHVHRLRAYGAGPGAVRVDRQDVPAVAVARRGPAGSGLARSRPTARARSGRGALCLLLLLGLGASPQGGAAGGGRSGNGGAVRGGRVHPRHGRGNSRSAGGGPAGPQRRMALTWGEC